MVKKIIIGIVILAIALFFGIKTVGYFKYTSFSVADELKKAPGEIGDSLEIKKSSLKEDEYLEIMGIKIKNVFEGYASRHTYNNDELREVIYTKKDLEGITSMITLSLEEDNLAKYVNEQTITSSDETLNFLNKLGIKNDYDLYRFIANFKEKKSNIFTSLSQMRLNDFANKLYVLEYSTYELLREITGDFEGYFIKDKNDLTYVLKYQDKKLYVIFNDDAIDETKALEIISSIIFV